MLTNKETKVADLFSKADILLFKDKKYHEAEKIYQTILEMEKAANNENDMNHRNCIDALNSIGYCLKFRTSLQDMLEDAPADIGPGKAAAGAAAQKVGVFTHLV